LQFQRVAQIQAQLDSLLFKQSAAQPEIRRQLSEVTPGEQRDKMGADGAEQRHYDERVPTETRDFCGCIRERLPFSGDLA